MQNFNGFKVTVEKLQKTLKFNNKCIENKVIPNYAVIKITNKTIAIIGTKERAEVMSSKSELNHCICKKTELKRESYTKTI